VVNSITYAKGAVTYSTFDAPSNTIDVLRLSFNPNAITADGQRLRSHRDLKKNGFQIKKLPNGDAIIQIRHDGAKQIVITGKDPQSMVGATGLQYAGAWEKQQGTFFTDEKDATVTTRFYGNQIRLVGRTDEFGGRAEVFIDGEKQMVPIDFWNPSPRLDQILYYKNGLETTEHTLKVVALGAGNPYSKGSRVYIDAVQFSAENKASHFPTATGSTEPQRMIFGYTKRDDYQNGRGNSWRPGTEVVFRAGQRLDTMIAGWWTNAADTVTGATDTELYRYGLHGHDFRVNLTVGPGKYGLRLLFANARGLDTKRNCFDISVNGNKVVKKLDVTAMAGGTNKAIDLFFNDIKPNNGVIEIHFEGLTYDEAGSTRSGEAFVQALEIGQGLHRKSQQGAR
jgi:hypothetical protein